MSAMSNLDVQIQENIEDDNWESSSDQVICPYCGHTEDVEYDFYFGDCSPNVYEEGEEDVTCPLCHHTFVLEKELNWNYTTRIKKGEEDVYPSEHQHLDY